MLTDEDLMLQLARKDDEQALIELVRRYREPLMNHFRGRGVQEEYEDLAQECFLRVYKARKRYKVTAKFRTWLYSIAQRVWIDLLRKRGRRQRRETAFREEPRPQSQRPRDSHRSDLDWALEQLPQGQRDVVVFSILDQLSHREISSLLEIPEGTVKSRLHTGLRSLRGILEADEQGVHA